MDGFEVLAIFMKFYKSKENKERKIITYDSDNGQYVFNKGADGAAEVSPEVLDAMKRINLEAKQAEEIFEKYCCERIDCSIM